MDETFVKNKMTFFSNSRMMETHGLGDSVPRDLNTETRQCEPECTRVLAVASSVVRAKDWEQPKYPIVYNRCCTCPFGRMAQN